MNISSIGASKYKFIFIYYVFKILLSYRCMFTVIKYLFYILLHDLLTIPYDSSHFQLVSHLNRSSKYINEDDTGFWWGLILYLIKVFAFSTNFLQSDQSRSMDIQLPNSVFRIEMPNILYCYSTSNGVKIT